MKFGVVSLESSESLWAAVRMADEGNHVLMYHAPPITNPFASPNGRRVGEGIVPLAKTWEQFVAWKPDIVFFDCTDYGKRADALRSSGVAVFGSCTFYDKLESDREFGIQIAQSIGVEVPEYFTFNSITDSISWLQERPSKEKWYFKTDRNLGSEFTCGGDKKNLTARLKYIRTNKGDRIKHLLQKGIDGAVLMVSTYWNGHTFLRPWMGTLERKEFGNDDTGPKTGCAVNVVWYYPEVPQIVIDEHWDKLAEVLRKHECPPGNVDMNVIIEFTSGKPYFLEWTPRLGIDSEPTASRLLTIDYSEFIARLCEATLPMAPFKLEDAAFAIRLSVPPYPNVPNVIDEKHSPIGLPLVGLEGSLWGEKHSDLFIAYDIKAGEDGYECGDPAGLIGIASAVGRDLEAMNKRCVTFARSLGIADLGYRTDGEIVLKKDLAAVRRAGYSAPLL
jgi:hypothetical protein